MKLRHNKKRNTAFLYEILVRQLTKSVIGKNKDEKNQLILVIREHFNENTLLFRELQLYNALNETSGLNPNTAEKLLFEVRREHNNIDKKEMFVEQTKLVNKVNKMFSKSIFSNFVPNYKDLATIYQIFNIDSVKVKKRVLLEQNIFEKLTLKTKTGIQQMAPIDSLVYKTFVNKFNDKYSEKLLKEQKELLNKYISSFANNGVELKIFLNEELGRLKKRIFSSLNLEEIKSDSEMTKKTKKILNVLEELREYKIDKSLINKVFKIQNLIKEIES